jgi:hypothetical protein
VCWSQDQKKKIEEAKALSTRATTLFKGKDYPAAIQTYTDAISLLENVGVKGKDTMKIALNNRAAAQAKLVGPWPSCPPKHRELTFKTCIVPLSRATLIKPLRIAQLHCKLTRSTRKVNCGAFRNRSTVIGF